MQDCFTVMEPEIDLPIMVSNCFPQKCDSCSTDNRIAWSSTQEMTEVVASTLDVEIVATAPIDLVVALESACWDLEFLVRWLSFFFIYVYNHIFHCA